LLVCLFAVCQLAGMLSADSDRDVRPAELLMLPVGGPSLRIRCG
jgi:hypothetical protein